MSARPECDVDGGTKGVETVTVTFRGVAYVIDLCENETKVLEVWIRAGSDTPRERGDRPKQPSHSVVPID